MRGFFIPPTFPARRPVAHRAGAWHLRQPAHLGRLGREITLRQGNRQALRERFREVVREDLSGQVKQVRQPTLILWGGQDRLIPPAQAQRFGQDIAGSRVQVFEDLGHVPQEEDPARTVAPVLAFLAQK